jgi:hypothetical protein
MVWKRKRRAIVELTGICLALPIMDLQNEAITEAQGANGLTFGAGKTPPFFALRRELSQKSGAPLGAV